MAAAAKAIKAVSYGLKVLLAVVGVALVMPVVFYIHPQALVSVIVQSRSAPNPDSPEPKDYELEGHNFYLSGSQGLIPVWHLYPQPFKSVEEAHEHVRLNGTKLLLHMHGTAYSRTHHLKALKELTRGGFHLIVPELRGFADATGSFTGYGAVEELTAVHNWMLTHFAEKKLVWWCLSLGAGICTQTARRMDSHRPDGLILEAPFSGMKEMLYTRTTFMAILGWVPVLGNAIVDRMISRYDMAFDNKANLVAMTDVPVLHLHAEDDATIRYEPHFVAVREALEEQFFKNTRTSAYFPVLLPACRELGHNPISEWKRDDTVQLVHHFWEEVNWPGTHTAKPRRKGPPQGDGSTTQGKSPTNVIGRRPNPTTTKRGKLTTGRKIAIVTDTTRNPTTKKKTTKKLPPKKP